MGHKQDQNNQRTAWVVSIVVHGLLLVAFVFMVAWREPISPHLEYGIEVNFGTEDIENQAVEESTYENEEEFDPSMVEEELIKDIASQETVSQEVQEAIVEDATEKTITQTIPNPDLIKKNIKSEEIIKKETPKTPVLYKKKDSYTNNSTIETETDVEKANQRDHTDEIGDKKEEYGSLYQRENKRVGEGRATLDLPGWNWDEKPNKKDPSNENGIVEFSFIINSEGEVEKIILVQSGLSPNVVNFYKEQLRNITFSLIDFNAAPLPQTKGTIKFVVKSK